MMHYKKQISNLNIGIVDTDFSDQWSAPKTLVGAPLHNTNNYIV